MANAKAPPYPKQRFSDAKFRETIPLLSIAEILKVEYLSKGTWYKMVSKRGNSYNCECCGVENIGPTPILDHVRGKKHRVALQNTEKLHHPNYTVVRTASVAAKTPLLTAQYAAAGSGTAKAAKPAAVKAGVTAQKPGVQQKPADAQAKPQKAPLKKATAAAGKAETAPQTATPQQAGDSQAESQPVKDKTDAKEGKETTESVGPPQKDQVQGATKPSNGVDSTSQQDKTKPKEEKQGEADGDTANKTSEAQKQTVAEEEDDESDVIFVSDNLKEISKAPETVETAKAITVINSGDPKPQRPQKNSAKQTATAPAPAQQNSGNEQRQVKQLTQTETATPNKVETPPATAPTPAKKVLNPAAIIAKSVEKKDDNAARYEQNRVIIPTIDKTRKRVQAPDLSAPSKTASPSFSAKTFSTDVNDQVEGIIGVEYVVKILKVYNDPEPFYECCLCEVVMDGIGMQTHLLGYNHRYKYLEKHFPTCFNQYKEHIGNIQVMGIILDRVAKAIESHHGRELPYECLSGEFRSNRHGVMTTVYSFRHASEYSGPSFTNVVDAKQVQEFYKKKNLYLPPKADPKRKPTFDTRNGAPEAKRSKMENVSARGGGGGGGNVGARGGGVVGGNVSARGGGGGAGPGVARRGGGRPNAGPPRRQYREEEPPMDDEMHKQMVEEFLQNTRERSRSPGGHRRRHQNRSRSRSPPRFMNQRARRSPSPLRDGDVWQAYRHLVDRSKVELDEMYREYRRDPEKHPLYDEEWRKFWKQRKDEMARDGLDYRNYDFQPEWVRFFAVRIEELYDEALENIKITSRQRLILPMTNEELEDKRYHVKVPEVEPMEVCKSKEQPPQPEMQKRMSVVHVLRLLTALEDYLGSLGPRVVDLLSKALLVEKSNPRDVNEIVLTLENCTVLETAMEKLKGVLIAGLLEGPKVRAFNNVITETEKILRYAFKMRELNPQTVPQPVPAPKSNFENQQAKQSFSGGSAPVSQSANPMGGSGSGAAANLLSQIDKKELATKLAAALTAQGKTDFNPEQLQQLIAVYSLIDKKKRDSAAADKQKMTLSDTLTALLNPKDHSGGGSGMSAPLSQSSGRNAGSYSNSNNDRPGPISNSSVNNFVSMLSRENQSSGGSKGGDSQMWQNLQNIQQSIRMQNKGGASQGSSGYNQSRGMEEASDGRSNYMANMPSGSSFTRSGFGGLSGSGSGTGRSEFSLAQGSSFNFNRGGAGGGPGNAGGNKDSSGGFYGNFQGMSNSSNSSFSRGGGDSAADGGRGFGSGNGGSFSGGNNYSRQGGGSGSSGFENNYMSGGPSGGSSGGGFGSSSYQRGSLGGGSGMGMGGFGNNGLGLSSGGGSSGLGMGSSRQDGSNFNRGGAPLGFGGYMNNSGSSFNKSSGLNDMGGGGGGGQSFGSSNSRNMGGNQGGITMGRSQLGGGGGMSMGGGGSSSQMSGGNRGGSNWRNQ